jgi:Ca2+-binding RTX toxin-like protein
MGFVVTGAEVLVGAGAEVSVAAGATGADVLVAAGATGADVLVAAGATGADVLVAAGATGAVVAVGVALLEQEASAKLRTHMRVMSFIKLLFIWFSSKEKLYSSDLSQFLLAERS